MDCAYTHAHIDTHTLSRHCMASILEAGRTVQDKTQNTNAVPLRPYFIHKLLENRHALSGGCGPWRSLTDYSQWRSAEAV